MDPISVFTGLVRTPSPDTRFREAVFASSFCTGTISAYLCPRISLHIPYGSPSSGARSSELFRLHLTVAEDEISHDLCKGWSQALHLHPFTSAEEISVFGLFQSRRGRISREDPRIDFIPPFVEAFAD